MSKDKCDFDSDCVFNHAKLNVGQHICYMCGDIFTSKRFLMLHIKAKHGNTPCHKFPKGQCSFNDNTCIYRHPEKVRGKVPMEIQKEKIYNLGFQGPIRNLKPPDWPELPVQTTEEGMEMTTLIHSVLNQMIPQLMKQIQLKFKK